MDSPFWHQLLIGFCMMLVLEGIVPFLYPQRWRNLVHQLGLVSNRGLRITGFISMMAGVILLYIFN
ncbi:DUF2065 domain-containing protein [Amphritea balenae]|uniref:DUF2065 domain-containing protein n=1 Tax=Amphritea balenae TaxID=452629 RepID=A0A3P1SRM5_9GAMM|nr:DUF2065 domain-containing protein [Amphritea balenae]RRC99760.1 DUF2065 domain-containing protein [Amphritea balenae]GGK79608.1 hypothetical protein GCM10007941_32360 [Amphritea balenae]